MPELLKQLQELAPWHFDLPLSDGLKTSDGNREQYDDSNVQRVAVIDPYELAPLLRRIHPDGLRGKRFLDVACNGGGYSIVAKSLGADLAVGFDAREHWVRQARFLAEQLQVKGTRFFTADLLSFTSDERFDICLFKGIFYHLPDPVAALRRVADLTDEVIIVDTETDGRRGDLCLRPHREGQTHIMSGVHGLAWWPSGPDLLAVILEWLGFSETREIFWNSKNVQHRGSPGRCRIIGARSPDILRAFDAPKTKSGILKRRFSL